MSLITVKEAARRLAISPDGVRRLINSGALDHCRPTPGTIRVVARSLDEHIERTTTRGRAYADPAALRCIKASPGLIARSVASRRPRD